MVRYVAWLANTALFALCCFLVADTANAIIAALLSRSPEQAAPSGPRDGPAGRSWDDRDLITQRNLFHSAVLSVNEPEPVPIDEELKETELPLKLWGTIAADDPALSWASVEDTSGGGAISAVRVGDKIQSATIVGIERRRVVLLENGNRRALSLDEEEADGAGGISFAKPTTRATTARATRTARRASARSRAAAATEKTESPVGNPTSLYSQARIVPEIDPETNAVTGLQLSAIQPGSVFEEIGIQNGEVITEIDGVEVAEIGDSTQIMSALTDPDEVAIVTKDRDGNPHQYTFAPPR